MIPETSEASIRKGNWFIFPDGEHTIQIWGSNLNGKEQVFLNGQLVSEQRSMKLNSAHTFTTPQGVRYEVLFGSPGLLKGVLTCTVTKNGVPVKTFHTRFVKGNNVTWKRLAFLLLAGVAFALLQITY